MFSQRLMRICSVVLMNTMIVLSLGCAATKPLPQPRKVIDPAEVSGAVQTSRWDIGAVHYEHFGQGMDYTEAGLEPIFLVFKNKSLQSPEVQVEEVRGVGSDGEYLPYSLDEASALVFASESFSVTTSNASRTGALGAFLGAGLGALIGTIGGGDNIWKGAAIGAAGGAVLGGAAGTYQSSERDLKRAVRKELSDYGWSNEPVPADYTKVGYIYFPAKVGIDVIKLVVRVDGQILRYTIDASDVAKIEK
ncbi:YMGG-like glycine zipper-containing protein [Desulfovibrio ferrophilus]|uniref:Glycine zipper domain-containing protein n=1 Tax=Desulfovibrio ferrophilus TaxID=241368 RepID=A0A2Z6AXJ1_9BACT|nr:glycine zipper domain-containing protein [Desulfovibrio ferrophilus]BBD07925.1 uncharacterized protein DFE_1199 [Desulfovibrio ferrophilus]